MNTRIVGKIWTAYSKLHWWHKIRPLLGISTMVITFGIALAMGLHWIWAFLAADGVSHWVDIIHKSIAEVYIRGSE